MSGYILRKVVKGENGRRGERRNVTIMQCEREIEQRRWKRVRDNCNNTIYKLKSQTTEITTALALVGNDFKSLDFSHTLNNYYPKNCILRSSQSNLPMKSTNEHEPSPPSHLFCPKLSSTYK
jgi:hypothetical protein